VNLPRLLESKKAKYVAFLDFKNKGLTKEIAKGLEMELD
jgi:hypothetical protein